MYITLLYKNATLFSLCVSEFCAKLENKYHIVLPSEQLLCIMHEQRLPVVIFLTGYLPISSLSLFSVWQGSSLKNFAIFNRTRQYENVQKEYIPTIYIHVHIQTGTPLLIIKMSKE